MDIILESLVDLRKGGTNSNRTSIIGNTDYVISKDGGLDLMDGIKSVSASIKPEFRRIFRKNSSVIIRRQQKARFVGFYVSAEVDALTLCESVSRDV